MGIEDIPVPSFESGDDGNLGGGADQQGEQAREKARAEAQGRQAAAARAAVKQAYAQNKAQSDELYQILLKFLEREEDLDFMSLIARSMALNLPVVVVLAFLFPILAEDVENEIREKNLIAKQALLPAVQGLAVFDQENMDEKLKKQILEWLNQINNAVVVCDYGNLYKSIRDREGKVILAHVEFLAKVAERFYQNNGIESPNQAKIYEFLLQFWQKICGERGRLEAKVGK